MAKPKHHESTSDEHTPVPDQYDAGYAARFRDEPMSVGATASWQAG